MAKNPERHTTGDESLHAKQQDPHPEQQLTALTLYVTNYDVVTCDRWDTPADCPTGRVVKQPGTYMVAAAPTAQHPCPNEPEAYLTIRSSNPNIFATAPMQLGAVITVAMTIAKPPPSGLALPEGQKLPPPRPTPGPGEPI